MAFALVSRIMDYGRIRFKFMKRLAEVGVPATMYDSTETGSPPCSSHGALPEAAHSGVADNSI